jgi:hypothetical protein
MRVSEGQFAYIIYLKLMWGLKKPVLSALCNRIGLATVSLFSVKTLWQGSFHILFQNEGIGLVRWKQAENGPKTSYVYDLRLSLGENVCIQNEHFQLVIKLKTTPL